MGVLKEKGIELDNLTLIQIVETIDRMYSDPRVKLWDIERVMPIVRGRLKEGWTERDVDEVIAYYIKLEGQFEKLKNISSMDKNERNKIFEEISSISEPKVLEALEAYRKRSK